MLTNGLYFFLPLPLSIPFFFTKSATTTGGGGWGLWRRGREREGVSNESGERTVGLFLCALQCQCEVFSLIEGPFSLLCGVKAVLIE